MNGKKLVDGKLVTLTDDEESVRAADRTKAIAEQPMNDWLQEMHKSDTEITRAQEDLIDHLINHHGHSVNPVIHARRNRKKEIRSRRPQ